MANLFRGMFESVFHQPQKIAVNGYFETFTSYRPVFTTWQGGLYEAELTRSVIESGAEHASKLKPEFSGVAAPQATRALRLQPNPWQTTPQFIKRIWTILQVHDTAFIVRLYNDAGQHCGYLPILPRRVEPYNVNGEIWLKMTFANGKTRFEPWAEVGVLTRHQYENDLFGDGQNALKPTLELIANEIEAEQEAIKQGAAVRFIGKFAQNLNPEDQKKRREEFNAQNLGADNAGGIAVYDRAFESVTQVTPQSYTVDAAQMERIEKSVYRYFGSNEEIVTNKADELTYNTHYEGRIEPFAVQLGTVLTCMTFTPFEISNGNEITFSANRLEFASNATKLNVALGLFDRGIWSGNDVADVFQSAHYDGGEKHVIRGEYIDLDLISEHTAEEAAAALEINSQLDEGGNNAGVTE